MGTVSAKLLLKPASSISILRMECMVGKKVVLPVVAPLTEEELDAITVVFHQYETGLREGTIYTRDLVFALHALGISPTEQEVIDMQNAVEKKGKIFFPDFCKLSLRKFREFDEENFKQELFKIICGTESHPARFRAKKYKLEEKFFSFADFRQMMTNLPEPVSDQEILEMFSFADKNNDGKISWEEFLVMITPVRIQETKKPVLIKPKLKSTVKLSSTDEAPVPDTTTDLVKTDAEDKTLQDTTKQQPVTETTSTTPTTVSQADPVVSTPVISEKPDVTVNTVKPAVTTVAADITTVTNAITGVISATTITATLTQPKIDTVPTTTTTTSNPVTTVADTVAVTPTGV